MIEIKPLASGSKGNCYWVTDGSSPLLLEAGIPLKDIRKGIDFRLSEVAGCLISHEHGDHAKAAKDLIRAGIDIYASQGTLEGLRLSGHRLHCIKAKYRFSVGSWLVMPFEVQHDAVEPLGFLLQNQKTREKLVYITDSYYTKYKFNKLNYIMVECNYALDILNENIRTGKVHPAQKNRIIQSHFSLENVKDFLKANNLSQVREIWLLHLSDRNSDAERFKREVQELTGKPVYIA